MMKIYLVGGAVRDQLLRLPIKEKDWVVVGSDPQEMINNGYKQVGKDFPVFLHPETGEEYALARTERKTGKGYYGFDVYAAPDVTLEDDLKRRDFTINAIAQDEKGNIIDPFSGQRDLKQKKLRHVSEAFAEDPVRILRGARFTARFNDFEIAPETLQLMKEMVEAGEVDALVSERVWQEFSRALSSSHPARFIETLRACGALKKLFPEIDKLFGIPQRKDVHPEIDTGIHTLMVLTQAAQLTPDPMVRFAALLHDLGKGETPNTQWPNHPEHEKRSVPLIKAFCKRLRVPASFCELARITALFHGDCHNAASLSPKAIISLFENTDAFRRPHRFQQLLLACEADSKGRLGYEKREYRQASILNKALEIAANVDVKPLLKQGLQGRAIQEALRKNRIEAINAITL